MTIVRATRYGVLLVDDDPMLLRVTARLLSTAFEVAIARTLDEALLALRDATPHVLITDLAIDAEHGEALLHVVQAGFPEVARVVLSGNSERLEAVRRAGLADVVLCKGEATPEAIVAAIRAVCPVR